MAIFSPRTRKISRNARLGRVGRLGVADLGAGWFVWSWVISDLLHGLGSLVRGRLESAWRCVKAVGSSPATRPDRRTPHEADRCKPEPGLRLAFPSEPEASIKAGPVLLCVCVCVCVCVCARACVRACVRVCVVPVRKVELFKCLVHTCIAFSQFYSALCVPLPYK